MISIKLCYVTYEGKMSLGAMKRFKELSGRDMWQTLCEFLAVFNKGRADDVSISELMSRLFKSCDFETASHLFYALIKEAQPEMDLDQIQDAMFRVGWAPNDGPEEGQPWPIIMVKVATQIDDMFKEIAPTAKKTRTDSEE